jgi:hypothetical protein
MIMMCQFDVIHNELALDLPLSRQAKVINLNYVRITYCGIRCWCSNGLDCGTMPQGTALGSG